MTYTDFIHPLCLPQKAELKQTSYDGNTLAAAGWGHTETGFFLKKRHLFFLLILK